MKILVTGGAGYIGSHLVKHLLAETEHEVLVLDNLSTGHSEACGKVQLIKMDLADFSAVGALLCEFKFDAVIHFAASSLVSESFESPFQYYSNNTANTLNLINASAMARVGYFIFSSTAAVYGEPGVSRIPINEYCLLNPINPYGKSKLASEWALRDIAVASEMKYGILRYFNVCGADREGRLGESHDPETHLIPLLAKTVLGKRPNFSIFGRDYDTPDGTCIRDYVDVEDLARAHLDVLNYLLAGHGSDVFNCGYGHGYSVQEVIDAMQRAAGKAISVTTAARRQGDPPVLVADASKLKQLTGWQPKNNDLINICESVLNWEKNARY
ncbi:UDP-glucose 4-epimerase GalE [Stutzerimonas stutzeri]|uniref:UDP-glucose 4-epimerase GalE n=1 Tax=Stutzerimonas stutzeri TaxID=316 RepID=UPI0017866BC1|nr:UDP-glucose 4-epimerase GalE [Stutzerimonas stutzeri]MBD9411582.1 UDP-glucose 4-epimerase GalE [Stutzerimonas stutzeri]